MPVTYPIVERIAARIATDLAGVKEAAGYQVTIAGVVRPRRWQLDQAPSHLEAVLVRASMERLTELDRHGNPPVLGWRAVWRVGVAVRLSDQDTSNFETVGDLAWGECAKALAVDRTFGGLAVDSRTGPSDFESDESGFEGVVFEVEADFRARETNPAQGMEG